jgi:hypothetical protein
LVKRGIKYVVEYSGVAWKELAPLACGGCRKGDLDSGGIKVGVAVVVVGFLLAVETRGRAIDLAFAADRDLGLIQRREGSTLGLGVGESTHLEYGGHHGGGLHAPIPSGGLHEEVTTIPVEIVEY